MTLLWKAKVNTTLYGPFLNSFTLSCKIDPHGRPTVKTLVKIKLYPYDCPYIIDPRPSTNQSIGLKRGSLFLVMVSVRPSIPPYVYKTKQTDQRVKPFFKLVLWLVLGRGSLYDSSLVSNMFN